MPSVEVVWYSWALPLSVSWLGREVLIVHAGPVRFVWGHRK
jgi:hypothetical protein